MQIGFHLTPFWSPTDRSATQIIDEAIEVVKAASTMGFGLRCRAWRPGKLSYRFRICPDH